MAAPYFGTPEAFPIQGRDARDRLGGVEHASAVSGSAAASKAASPNAGSHRRRGQQGLSDSNLTLGDPEGLEDRNQAEA